MDHLRVTSGKIPVRAEGGGGGGVSESERCIAEPLKKLNKSDSQHSRLSAEIYEHPLCYLPLLSL